MHFHHFDSFLLFFAYIFYFNMWMFHAVYGHPFGKRRNGRKKRPETHFMLLNKIFNSKSWMNGDEGEWESMKKASELLVWLLFKVSVCAFGLCASGGLATTQRQLSHHLCMHVYGCKSITRKWAKLSSFFSFSIWTVECSSLQKCYAKPPVRGNGKNPLQIIPFFNSLTYSPQFSFNQYLCLPMVNTKPNKTPTNHQLDVTIMHSDEANEQKKNTSEHHSFA